MDASMGNDRIIPSLGLYDKAVSDELNYEEKLCLAWRSGFDFLELCIDMTQKRLSRLCDPAFASSLRRAISNTGVKIQTFALTANRGYPLGSENAAIRDKGIELVLRAVDLCGETGIRTLHLAAYDELGNQCNEHTMSLFFDAVCRCARYSAAAGVMLALETMDQGRLCGMDNLIPLLGAVNSPYLGCYADIGNLSATGHDPAAEFVKAKGHIVGVHLKDAYPNVCRDVPLGDGIVDFGKGLGALFALGYGGPFVAEMWSYDDAAFHERLLPASAFLRRELDAFYAPQAAAPGCVV